MKPNEKSYRLWGVGGGEFVVVADQRHVGLEFITFHRDGRLIRTFRVDGLTGWDEGE